MPYDVKQLTRLAPRGSTPCSIQSTMFTGTSLDIYTLSMNVPGIRDLWLVNKFLPKQSQGFNYAHKTNTAAQTV